MVRWWTTGEISALLAEVYAASVSKATLSSITDSVIEGMVELQNRPTHKAPGLAEWLAHPKRARWHLHFTPTPSWGLNLVESWSTCSPNGGYGAARS